MGIKILTPGVLTTVQDAGRFGYQQFGVAASGSMDMYHHGLANILVGNPFTAEALECTMIGPTFRFTQDNIFAICGAPVSATLDDEPIEMNKAYLGTSGAVVKMGPASKGCRTYIAFSGGFDIPFVMGSKSTYIKGEIGGLEGRALQTGDRIGFVAPKTSLPNMEFRRAHSSLIHDFEPTQTIRIISGPQLEAFSGEGFSTLLSKPYTVTSSSDRMGYRLDGAKIKHASGCDGNIISDAITKGAIQVPGHGQPIIMMADRQTTGGYAKIGHVITVDLPLVAQLRAGGVIRFALCDVETAQKLLNERIEKLKSFRKLLDQNVILSSSDYSLRSPNGDMEACIMEIKS